MPWSERFVVGRVRRRVLRTPAIDGWRGDEHDPAATERVTVPLVKVDGQLALSVPDRHDVVKLGEVADAIAGDACELLVGWPERIVIARTAGIVVYADGDAVHFGPLALDADHTIERTGYEYLNDTDAEVRVELTIAAGGDQRIEMMDPGATIVVGPYRIAHRRSFDPSDRPVGGRHHGYDFVISRTSPPAGPPAARSPHPLDVDAPADILALARDGGFLGDDEAALGEGAPYLELAGRYEGPRQKLDAELRRAGPDPAELRRLGELVQVTTPGLWRGSHGDARYGHITVTLGPLGGVTVERSELGTMPGRLRKRH